MRAIRFGTLLVAAALIAGASRSTIAQERLAEAQLVTKITAPFSVATVGDIIAPQPFDRGDLRYKALVERIRDADVGFANMELSLVDLNTFKGGFAGTVAPLAMGKSIEAAGIDLVNHANNHTFDGGAAGMISTDRALDQLGIVHAGTGANLEEARAAAFLNTSKGRVGLVGTFAVSDIGLFGPNYAKTEATPRVGNVGGAPGVAQLHLTAYNVVSPQQLASLEQIARATYGDRTGALVPAVADRPQRFRFYDQWYEAGKDVGAIHYDMNRSDESAYLDAVRSGKVRSDFLIATIHSHQTPRFCAACAFDGVKGMKEDLAHQPPAYLQKLAHEAIDSGADMFVVHGVHALSGVEIYKGKPILYGLSNFVFQFSLQFAEGYDALANYRKRAELDNSASLQSMLAVSLFDSGRLTKVLLYPVELGEPTRALSQLGLPRAPDAATARRIIADLQRWSAPFGTHIKFVGDHGEITMDRP